MHNKALKKIDAGIFYSLWATSGAMILIVGGPPENWMGQLK